MQESMTEILTAAEMAAADRMTIESGTSEAQLILAAGKALAEKVYELSKPGDTIVVCCGRGNNGADGYACAAALFKKGRRVKVISLGKADTLKGEVKNFARTFFSLTKEHIHIDEHTDEKLIQQYISCGKIVVDALFGTGLNKAPAGGAVKILRAIQRSGTLCVAADLPSGIHADTAAALGNDVVRAAMTVTFFCPKLAHYLYPAAEYCGRVVCVPIGIKSNVLKTIKPSHHINSPALYRSHIHPPNYRSHKYTRGHALIFAGECMPGAGALACRAAQKSGCGLVSAALSQSAADRMRPLLPASCILRSEKLSGNLQAFVRRCKANALLIGPGNGKTPQTTRQVLSLLSTSLPLVLDADALCAFAEQPTLLTKQTAAHGLTVMTPHMGEFKRLFTNIQENNKAQSALMAAKQSGAVIILKGPDTVIAAPSGEIVIARKSSPYLATGGSGDVLGGILVALLAQNIPPFIAACASVDIHNQCALHAGVHLTPEDLIHHLPKVFTELFLLK